MLRLKRVQAGIVCLRAIKGVPSHTRLPITVQLLEKICKHLEAVEETEKPVLQAITTTAFCEFFRLGELLPGATKTGISSATLVWGGRGGGQPHQYQDGTNPPQMLKV